MNNTVRFYLTSDAGKCNDDWCCLHGEECKKMYKHRKTCHKHMNELRVAEKSK